MQIPCPKCNWIEIIVNFVKYDKETGTWAKYEVRCTKCLYEGYASIPMLFETIKEGR